MGEVAVEKEDRLFVAEVLKPSAPPETVKLGQ